MATFDEQSFPSQMRTAIFRDQHHVRRLNVRPYHRLVVLVRGHRPSVLPSNSGSSRWVRRTPSRDSSAMTTTPLR